MFKLRSEEEISKIKVSERQIVIRYFQTLSEKHGTLLQILCSKRTVTLTIFLGLLDCWTCRGNHSAKVLDWKGGNLTALSRFTYRAVIGISLVYSLKCQTGSYCLI